MGGRELEFVQESFRSNYIAPVGPMVYAFEAEFSAYVGIPHCAAVSSGTAAMHLALRGLGVGPGDVVLGSTLTFIGSISPAAMLGAELVLVDSSADTWNLDPPLLAGEVERLVRAGKTPKAVIPTDLYGQSADLDAIRAVCDPHGIPVVEDAAEAIGASYKGGHVGRRAKIAIFSFNGNKILTTGGGGMIGSADPEVIARARYLANQANDPSLPYYEHREIGYNYRLSNILAAIGRGQLCVLDERIRRRREIQSFLAWKSPVLSRHSVPELPAGRLANGS